MHNPFSGSKLPVRRSRDLIGRQAASSKLEELLLKRMNAVIMGPEGIGKSSFLNAFLDRERRLRMAREARLLIVRTMFPVHLAGEDVYHYLADAIESSLSILLEADPLNADLIIAEVATKRNLEFGSSRLQEICKVIDEREYDITLVIDDFENFTSSRSIAMDHHALMRNLIRDHYANYVVATNYDFNQDSLPKAVSGSFLLMEFSGNEIILPGFDEEECRAYLEAQGAEGFFSEEECGIMMDISGGIPALLRITAEAAWDKKQTTPVLTDDVWDDIVDQLCADPRVKRYMSQWCRVLTAKHIEVFDQLLDESNRLHRIQGQTLSAAVASLCARGLLVPRYRDGQIMADCYEFCSELLENHCRSTILSVSNPHDVQKHSIAAQLKDMVEKGEQAQVLKLLREICAMMDNVTMPIDYEEPVTNETLQKFALNEEMLNSFDPFVREQIICGIRIERTYMQVSLPDYAPVYISFAKAIEAHINKLVVPFLKRITPNHVLPGNRILRNTSNSLMLGEIHAILSCQKDALHTTVYKEAAEYCVQHGCADFDEQWWDNLTNDLYYIKELRNDMPHSSPLSGEDGVSLLRRLFQGEFPFMYRCSSLYEALENAQISEPENNLQVGAIVTGTVRNVTYSGAFIDIGAERDGFLHISEVKYGYVQNIHDEFTRGQQVRVKILTFDPDNGNIKLSKKDVPQN